MQVESSWKTLLPLARIKTIMKLDPSVTAISQDALYAVTVATQLFLELLTMESFQFTLQQGRKTIIYRDVCNSINDIHEFEFLTEICPFTMPIKDAVEKREHLMELKQDQNEHF